MNVKTHPGDIECAALHAASVITSKLNLSENHKNDLSEKLRDIVSNYMVEQGFCPTHP